MAIVCHGCGASLTVPDDYLRNKMQCPACGVMCQILTRPAVKKQAEERPPAEDAAGFADDEPVTPIHSPPPPVTTFLEKPAAAGAGLATCPHCGEIVRTPAAKRGKRAKCSVCGGALQAPAVRRKPVLPPLPVPPPPDEFAGSTPDEDPETSNPYRTADPGSRRCPGCTAQLGSEVVVCVRCGFDLRVGRKTVKEYQKIERSWDSGMPPRLRRTLFLLCQLAAFMAIVAGFMTVEDPPLIAVPTYGLSWLVYTVMTAFMLGTYDHSELKRHRSGRVELTRTWRFGFIPRQPTKIDVRDYSGVSTGVTHVDWWEWIIFISLFGFGVVPAIIYWYCAIYKVEYRVALTKDHEVPEIYVYRGWNPEQMHEIKQILRDALTV